MSQKRKSQVAGSMFLFSKVFGHTFLTPSQNKELLGWWFGGSDKFLAEMFKLNALKRFLILVRLSCLHNFGGCTNVNVCWFSGLLHLFICCGLSNLDAWHLRCSLLLLGLSSLIAWPRKIPKLSAALRARMVDEVHESQGNVDLLKVQSGLQWNVWKGSLLFVNHWNTSLISKKTMGCSRQQLFAKVFFLSSRPHDWNPVRQATNYHRPWYKHQTNQPVPPTNTLKRKTPAAYSHFLTKTNPKRTSGPISRLGRTLPCVDRKEGTQSRICQKQSRPGRPSESRKGSGLRQWFPPSIFWSSALEQSTAERLKRVQIVGLLALDTSFGLFIGQSSHRSFKNCSIWCVPSGKERTLWCFVFAVFDGDFPPSNPWKNRWNLQEFKTSNPKQPSLPSRSKHITIGTSERYQFWFCPKRRFMSSKIWLWVEERKPLLKRRSFREDVPLPNRFLLGGTRYVFESQLAGKWQKQRRPSQRPQPSGSIEAIVISGGTRRNMMVVRPSCGRSHGLFFADGLGRQDFC